MTQGLLRSCPVPPTTDPRWDEQVRLHRRTVELSLLAAGAPLDVARELAHEAFARVFEQWATGRLPRVEFPGVVMRQASFLLLERRRTDGAARSRRSPLEAASELPAGGAPADRSAVARQLLELASAALERVSPRDRQVLAVVLRNPEAPHAPLAAGFGLSVQRFRQILCEVRARLRAVAGGDE